MKLDFTKLQSIRKQAGFIITLELLLILTILGIGLFVGLVAIRDALIKYQVSKQSQEIYVSDGNGTLLGKSIGFDLHEAPLVFYIDRSIAPLAPDPLHKNYRALIGVRDDRFTSREPVYYTEPNCQGQPCIKRPSAEIPDNRGVDALPGTGSVSYLYAIQGGPTYAIGRSPQGIPGFLFRQGADACPVDEITALTGSRYMSQKVEHGEPCESPYQLPIPVGEVPRLCDGEFAGGLLCPQTGPTACGSVPGVDGAPDACGCPVGYYDAGASLGLIGQCCPNGYTLEASGLLGLDPTCTGGGLVTAVSVPDPNNADQNALEQFTFPFSVNLPGDTSSQNWEYILPHGEDGPHGGG